jgi:chromosome partitioning protein
MLSIAFVNAKPGTGKTTSAVWLAHAFMAAGRSVFLVDADPTESVLEWADLAGSFLPIRVAKLPYRDLHRQIPDYARPDDVVIIDSGQLEDHVGIARSAMRYADEIVIPTAPTVVEISRTAPMRTEIEDINVARQVPARSVVLLNRTIAHANSTAEAKTALEDAGMDVLPTTIPRLEMYAQSYGGPVVLPPGDPWTDVARDLAHRAEVAEVTR